MMAHTHMMVGAGTYTLVSTLATAEPISGIALGAAVLGSVAPDIDTPASYLGRRLWPFSLVFGLLAGHRGITHSLFALALVSAALVFFVPSQYASVALAFILGYASHIFADWNTNSGVPFFWPSKQRTCAPWSFSTGSMTEVAIGAVFVAGFAIWGSIAFDVRQMQEAALQTAEKIHGWLPL
ncbi:MAG: metal-dependent hydrolase [Desulfuromonadaceae bacterium]|nr:metal-dependent hydrolase [Desulfuromonadaceae bacterium]